MNIKDAYDALKVGLTVRRKEWGGRFLYIPDEDKRHVIAVKGSGWIDLIHATQERFYPTIEDITSDDWQVITFRMEEVNNGETD